jgi:hypothetical protein
VQNEESVPDVDSGQVVEDVAQQGRPRREKKKPVKMKDYVLY